MHHGTVVLIEVLNKLFDSIITWTRVHGQGTGPLSLFKRHHALVPFRTRQKERQTVSLFTDSS